MRPVRAAYPDPDRLCRCNCRAALDIRHPARESSTYCHRAILHPHPLAGISWCPEHDKLMIESRAAGRCWASGVASCRCSSVLRWPFKGAIRDNTRGVFERRPPGCDAWFGEGMPSSCRPDCEHRLSSREAELPPRYARVIWAFPVVFVFIRGEVSHPLRNGRPNRLQWLIVPLKATHGRCHGCGRTAVREVGGNRRTHGRERRHRRRFFDNLHGLNDQHFSCRVVG